MKKNIKGFIAKLLVLCMVVGLLPVAALSAGAANSAQSADGTYYSISADTNTLSLTAGQKGTLRATVQPENALVNWSSNSTSVATVSGNGATATVTAKAAGTATITAAVNVTTATGSTTISVTYTVTVRAATVAVTGITLSESELSLTVGGTSTLTATVEPSNATNQNVTWSSSDTSVATVSNEGVVTAVASGKATITATAGSFSATCEVTVKESASVDVEPDVKTENGTVSATVSDSAMDKAVEEAKKAANDETAPVVSIKVPTTADAENLEVNLPAESLGVLAKVEDASLAIMSDIAEITLDNRALNALVEEADAGTVTLEVKPSEEKLSDTQKGGALSNLLSGSSTTAAVFDLSLTVGEKSVHSFGKEGKLSISLPYKLPQGAAEKAIMVYFLNDRGMVERQKNVSFKDGKVNFTTKHLSTYVVSPTDVVPEADFDDVVEGLWHYDYVDWAYANKITTGYSDSTFAPEDVCTRAQFVTFLWRAAGEKEPTMTTSPFVDVSEAEYPYYYKAILWAYENGITDGYGDGNFGPKDPVLRGQAVTFMKRAADKDNDKNLAPETGAPSFTDVENEGVMAYYYAAIGWAEANNLTNGFGDGRFKPLEGCKRAEMVTFLYRLYSGVPTVF